MQTPNRVEMLESRWLLSTVSFTQQTYAVDFPGAVAIADFNGDGIPDIAVTNENQDSVEVFLGNGNSTFRAPLTFTAGYDANHISVADLNGDGKADIIVSSQTGGGLNGTVSILLGNGNGTFQPQQTFMAASYFAGAIAIGDFNGDGKTDFITVDGVHGVTNQLSVLLGNGNGTFLAPQTIAVGAYPSSLAIGDFNGDGIQDIVGANSAFNTDSGTVSVLLGNGNGTFQQQVTIGVGADPVSVVVADLTGDGKEDIVTANAHSDSVSILLGNGNGTFQPQVTLGVGAGLASVAVGDFTGDGRTDIVVANEAHPDYGVGLLINNGNGTFQNEQTFAIKGQLPAVAVADFNDDGLSDIAVTTDENVLYVLTTQPPSESFATLSDGVLAVTGTSGNDSISITDTDGSVIATLNGMASSPFTASDITGGISVTGGAGNDTISVAGIPIASTIGGAGGDDCITGGAGNDSLKGGAGNDTIGGAGGDDTIVGGGDDDSLKGGDGNDFLAGGPGNDTLHGCVGNDSLIGGAGDDQINGNAGDDTILGTGSSQLFAGPGNDSITGNTSTVESDSIYCGSSTDTILAGSDDQIFDSVQGDSITGGQIVG